MSEQTNSTRTPNHNEKEVYKIFKTLKNLKDHYNFVTDKSGVNMVELIAPRMELDPREPLLYFNGRKTPEKYCEAELQWYQSQDLSVEFIGQKAKIWRDISSAHNEVNSNYGWCIFSKENYKQFDNCFKELCHNSESRRACMIYTRPSMQYDYHRDGMDDFICTNTVQCMIRNNELKYIVHMRSNDAIFGFFNDFYWHCYVYNLLFEKLKWNGFPDLKKTEKSIIWLANSFHIYERHFNMLDDICDERIAWLYE